MRKVKEEGESGWKCCPMPGGDWQSRRAPEQPPALLPDPHIPWWNKMSRWRLVTGCCFFQLLPGIVPKLNAERTPLFSKVKPPCCSIFFFASSICREKGKKRRVFKVTKLERSLKEPDSLYSALWRSVTRGPNWAFTFNRCSSVSSCVNAHGKIVG